jgi:hypothetical protein
MDWQPFAGRYLAFLSSRFSGFLPCLSMESMDCSGHCKLRGWCRCKGLRGGQVTKQLSWDGCHAVLKSPRLSLSTVHSAPHSYRI